MNMKLKIWLAAPAILFGSTLAKAEEGVRMYGHGEIPKAAEVANILGAGKPKMPGAGRPKMRGIRLDPAYKTDDRLQQSLDEINKPKTEAVGLPVEFAFNSAEILPENEPVLTAIADGIKMTDGLRVVVEGHTDAHGSDHYNRKLSQSRAMAVKKFLVQQHSISSSQLIVKGLGESNPYNTNDPYAPENRRVQFRAAQ